MYNATSHYTKFYACWAFNAQSTFSSVHLHLQKVIEATSTLLDRLGNTTQQESFKLMKYVKIWFSVLSVDCLMFDTSKNDAADVYKAQ